MQDDTVPRGLAVAAGQGRAQSEALVLSCEMGEPGLEHAHGKLSPQCMPLQAVPIHFGFGCGCGIIRRRYGELSRHSCIQRDSIRPMAFQKFPQRYGLRPANFEGLLSHRRRLCGGPRQGWSCVVVVVIIRDCDNRPEPADNHCARPAAPSVGEKDSPGGGPRNGGHPGQRYEGGQFCSKDSPALGGCHDTFQRQHQPCQSCGDSKWCDFSKAPPITPENTSRNLSVSGHYYFRVVHHVCAVQQVHGRASIHGMAELVYMVLMYGPKPAASLALTEMLDKYRDDEVVLEVIS